MQDLTAIAKKIRDRAPGAALTGAGVSAESGISTYREPGGLWDSYAEGQGGGMLAVLAAHPDKAPEILGGFFAKLLAARPNPGHLALAGMEEAGLLSAVITQNVDNLHRAAGSKNVYEMHGNMFRLRCLACGITKWQDKAGFQNLADKLLEHSRQGVEALANALPVCACGGLMRPDFVSFGEPVQDLEQAIQSSRSAGFMLICGTSGVVHPAASMPRYAKKEGAYIVEINPQPSDLTDLADDFIPAPAGEVLPRLCKELGIAQNSPGGDKESP